MQKSTIASRVIYERFTNGLDVFLLPTRASGILTALMRFPGGSHYSPENPFVPEILAHTMPTGTGKRKRSVVRELLDACGARVSVVSHDTYLQVALSARASVFHHALTIVLESLAHPRVTDAEYAEVHTQMMTAIRTSRENTAKQVHIALMRALYREGHPHFTHTSEEAGEYVSRITKDDLLSFHRSTFSAVGSLMCIAGDVPKGYMEQLRTQTECIPQLRPSREITVHPDRTQTTVEREYVIPIPDKINIDTSLAIPLSITRESESYYPLLLGTAILGGSFTSRLFTSLRGKQSLTYGAYASLGGMSEGFAGYLLAHAIFPHDVFLRGRAALREEVATFIDKGVTRAEVQDRKTEIAGKYTVGLSTTAGLCKALFEVVSWGRPVPYLDEYPDLIGSIERSAVNSAIKSHLRYEDAITGAAGTIS